MTGLKRGIYAGIVLAAIAAICGSYTVYASTVTMYPDSDPGSSIYNPSTGSTRYTILDNTSPVNGQQICTPGQSSTMPVELYGAGNVNVGQGATSVVVNTNAADDYLFAGSSSLAPRLTLGIYIGGTSAGSETYTPPQSGSFSTAGCATSNANNWPYANHSTPSFTPGSGAWSQTQMDGMQFAVNYTYVSESRSQALRQLNATVTYDAMPTLSMNGSKVYNNANSTTPGSQLADYGATASLPTKGAAFRLRMNVANSGTDRWRAGFGVATLQFARKTVSDCSTQTGYVDVQSGSGDIRWNTNASVSNGASISILAGDSKSASLVAETYRSANSFTPTVDIPSGKSGQWDFSLIEAAPVPGAAYCFKIAPSSGITGVSIANNAATAVVQSVGSLDVDIVDGSGVSVANPLVSFGLLTPALICQTSTATLGSSTQKIRLSNGSASNGWSVSIAATAGSTALWSTTGGSKYDFNDSSGSPAGCGDGGDADTYAGQLSLSPSASTVTALSGCSNATGITKGSNAAYSEGSINSITLLSASSSADMYCYWDITGIGLSQKVPPSTPVGTYTLDLTVTAVAS